MLHCLYYVKRWLYSVSTAPKHWKLIRRYLSTFPSRFGIKNRLNRSYYTLILAVMDLSLFFPILISGKHESLGTYHCYVTFGVGKMLHCLYYFSREVYWFQFVIWTTSTPVTPEQVVCITLVLQGINSFPFVLSSFCNLLSDYQNGKLFDQFTLLPRPFSLQFTEYSFTSTFDSSLACTKRLKIYK